MSNLRFALASAVWLATLARPAAARAGDGADVGDGVITERSAALAALEHNPTLAAAVGDLRRAELLERAEEHRYSFVLALDGSADRSRPPSLGPTGVTVPDTTTYVGGVELRRHLVLGTDVTLRFEGSSQRSRTTFLDAASTPPSVVDFSMGPAYGTSVKLSLTQPLLRGAGRNVYYADLDAARANRASARSGRDQTASQLLSDVLTAYWELYYATRAVEIDRQSLELARAQRDDTAERVRTGSAARVDLLSFETRIAGLEEDLATAQAEERTRLAELARLIGRPDLAGGADTASPLSEPEPPLPDVKDRAQSASFELEQQRAAVALAEVQAKTAEEPFRSRLDLNAYVQAQGLGNQALGPSFDQLTGLGAVSAHIGFSYEAPLDGTQRRSERERALLAVRTAKDRLVAVEQRLAADVDKALTREGSGRLRVKLADATLAIAKEQLEAETQRFRTGSSTALQVREAEDQVRSAELRAERARTDWIEADLTLAHLSGRLLERWEKLLSARDVR